jgi:hypothetical protein
MPKRKSKYNNLNLELQKKVAKLEKQIEVQQAQLDLREKLKDEAMQRYVNDSIAIWNSAIRATGGPRPNETSAEYNARLVKANKK